MEWPVQRKTGGISHYSFKKTKVTVAIFHLVYSKGEFIFLVAIFIWWLSEIQ